MSKKHKPGSAAELANFYPGPRRVPVRIIEVKGAGDTREVVTREVTVLVYELPVTVIARVAVALGAVMEPGKLLSIGRFMQLAAEHQAEVFAAVHEATGMDVADIANIRGADFYDLVDTILTVNQDFCDRLLEPLAFVNRATGRPRPNGDGSGVSTSFKPTAEDQTLRTTP